MKNVVVMYGTFCIVKTFNQDVSALDTSNVPALSPMLYESSSFYETIDIGNTKKIKDFNFKVAFATQFNQDIRG